MIRCATFSLFVALSALLTTTTQAYDGLLPSDAGDPNIPDLIYNPGTGEVILDVDGSGIIGYVLKNLSNAFAGVSHTPILGGLATSLDFEVSEASFASPVGANSIGSVFPTGLNLSGLTALLSTNSVSRGLGLPNVPFELFLATPAPAADVGSNASFSTGSNLDILNIDFGTVAFGDSVTPVSFDIANLVSPGTTANLDLTSISGTGDSGTLTTDLTTFSNLAAGLSLDFDAMIDTSVSGTFGASYDLSFTDVLGTNQTLTLNLSGVVDLPPFASNASFSTGSDQDVLNIDFGTVTQYDSVAPIDFDIANLAGAGTTAALELVSVTGSGDTARLLNDLAPFTDLAAGSSLNFDALFDAVVPGDFNATYQLNFTDVLGTNQTLTLNISGEVEELILPPPPIPSLRYDPSSGEVVLIPNGGSIIAYGLKNLTNSFLPGNHITVLAGVATSLPSEIAEAAFAPLTSAVSIGNIFPLGLDLAGLTALLSEQFVHQGLGQPVEQFNLTIYDEGFFFRASSSRPRAFDLRDGRDWSVRSRLLRLAT